MKIQERLLDLLACPTCRGRLASSDDGAVWEGATLVEGALVCDWCRKAFPVRNGIPRFVSSSNLKGREDSRIAEHFRNEFVSLSKGNLDIDPPELIEYYFLTRTGIDPNVFEAVPGDPSRTEVGPQWSAFKPDYGLIANRVVLDAGCGPGRFTRVAAREADLVVGLDLGDHIDRAAHLCTDLENVEFVQGSVLAPPFRQEAFDLAFSVGVLHHTPDPSGGVKAIGDCVRRGGYLSVWVYSPRYWNGLIRGLTGRLMHAFVKRLSPRWGWMFCAHVLYPIGRMQALLTKRRWTKLLFAPLFALSIPRHPRREVMITTIYDYFGPPIISTHTFEELEGWFEEAGIRESRRVPLPTAVIGRRG